LIAPPDTSAEEINKVSCIQFSELKKGEIFVSTKDIYFSFGKQNIAIPTLKSVMHI
jgi:hypothetical protein